MKIFFQKSKILVMSESDDNQATPRSAREQLREVVDSYKERLREIKGQVHKFKEKSFFKPLY